MIGVMSLSTSFDAVWPALAEEVGADLVSCTAAEPLRRAACIIVAAGGEEDRGLDALAGLAESHAPIYCVGTRASHRFAIEALRRGAADYFVFPSEADLLRRTVASRVEAARGRAAMERRADGDPFKALVGKSPALRETIARAARVLPHRDVTVLIGGETGTGKELLARALHEGGPRRDGPFVAINCAAVPGQLLESELFGHERGAFTDAHRAKPGLFEEADRGTLLLDEIGHLPLELQGKLLRALDEHSIRRVGGNAPKTVDVRVMAATHVDLNEAVLRGEFRQDLFYRLNVVSLVLPPLRERGADVLLLAETFAAQIAARYGLPVPRLTTPVRDALQRHPWPGNVRELRHAVERAMLLSPPGTLDPAELAPPSAPKVVPGSGAASTTMTEVERHAALEAVARHGGNKSAAARSLGISRARLQRLLDEGGGA